MTEAELEKAFIATFDAKPSLHTPDIFFYHEEVEYRFYYSLKTPYNPIRWRWVDSIILSEASQKTNTLDRVWVFTKSFLPEAPVSECLAAVATALLKKGC